VHLQLVTSVFCIMAVNVMSAHAASEPKPGMLRSTAVGRKHQHHQVAIAIALPAGAD
jgi:hypothetical protein